MSLRHLNVVLLSMTDLANDARTLLLARTLERNEAKVSVVCTGNSGVAADGFLTHKVNVGVGRAWVRMHRFTCGVAALSLASPQLIHSMDYYSLPAGVRLAAMSNSPLVYDAREIYSALASLRHRPLAQWMIARREASLVKKTAGITVSGPLDAQLLHNRFNHSYPPVLLPNVPPYRPVLQSNLLRKRFSINPCDTIVIYQGVVCDGRGLLPFLRAMPALPRHHLCIVGDGPLLSDVLMEGGRLGVSGRVHHLPTVAYDQLHEVTCSADVGLCLIEPVSESYLLALPNKLFEYAMAGLPSLVADLPAMRPVIENYPMGRLLQPPFEASAIVAALTALDSPETRSQCINAARKVAANYNYEKGSEATLAMYAGLTSGRE